MHKIELRSLMRQRKRQFTQQQLRELSLPIIDHLRYGSVQPLPVLPQRSY